MIWKLTNDRQLNCKDDFATSPSLLFTATLLVSPCSCRSGQSSQTIETQRLSAVEGKLFSLHFCEITLRSLNCREGGLTATSQPGAGPDTGRRHSQFRSVEPNRAHGSHSDLSNPEKSLVARIGPDWPGEGARTFRYAPAFERTRHRQEGAWAIADGDRAGDRDRSEGGHGEFNHGAGPRLGPVDRIGRSAASRIRRTHIGWVPR
jgi:hypothetical protein